MEKRAEIGIFGGSGFYQLTGSVEEIKVETPYGPPSDTISLAEIGGRKVAFLPRHSRNHSLPPHRIPYRANLWAMKQLGVTRIIGPCAAGSLQKHVQPGEFVICDQFVDRTRGREDTFYDGPIVTHVSAADPYCPEMRRIAIEKAEALPNMVHRKGTVVVIQGPRFSTRSESRWFSAQGWEVINMTQYPECILARELEMCYLNISLITDYDVGLEGMEPVTAGEVLEVFKRNNEIAVGLITEIIEGLPGEPSCGCGKALQGARVES
ncbi:MAG: S-methyl-5'-thioadenosine phosphorylase [Armatimonadetes bacterium]|nr:S-methyl-5'-thioadenosine phosphorylase [Armatimonadota bacterium]